jgi:hypothetical protein
MKLLLIALTLIGIFSCKQSSTVKVESNLSFPKKIVFKNNDSTINHEVILSSEKEVIKDTYYWHNGKKQAEYLYSSDEYGLVVFYDTNNICVAAHPICVGYGEWGKQKVPKL